jgi:GTP-binding protein
MNKKGNIKSAVFARSVVDDSSLPPDTLTHVAFIGRSNVGKSSVINALTGQKNLARSSSAPGFTKEANFFLINNAFYLVDLPGYGYAKGSFSDKELLRNRILWYFGNKKISQYKVVLIIDAKVGPTPDDEDMLLYLQEKKKEVVIVANKIDKLKANDIKKSMAIIEKILGPHLIIPFSAEKKIGIGVLTETILPR